MTRVFTGPNSFALKQAVRQAKNEFIKEYGELAVEIIDGEESTHEHIIAAIKSVPFLAEKKLVVVYNLSAIKEAAEEIERFIQTAIGGNELLIVETKLDKRGTYYKYLKKNVDLAEFSELDDRSLANWLAAEARKAGAILSNDSANYLIQRVGNNQQSIEADLKKLIDYDKNITRQTIDLLTEASPQTNIFNLLDSVFSGNLKRALAIYDEQRTQGEEPLKIFGLIIWQMHLVALVDSAHDKSDDQIMKASGLKPFTLNKSRLIADRMGPRKIKETINRLIELDRQLKMTSVDADDALKGLLTAIS